MAGHQPELFHPGVWVKNFALAGIARSCGVLALNLIVDNDTLKSTALRLPAPPDAQLARPHYQSVAFDHWAGEVAFEERTIHDRQLFESFAERAGRTLAGWNYEPMLGPFWAEVLRQSRRTPLLGERFAAARRTWERHWGCHNLEVPLSAVCSTAPFAWFVCHLLAELPRFHSTYNDCVRDYRRDHGIRSRNHPVPDLSEDGGWLEAPFWAWRQGQSRRSRLFVRLGANRVELRVGGERWPDLPAPRTQPELAVAAWMRLEEQGLKVRTRALTTTLFSRLMLCDLFVHGIGGGKYDEVTDSLMMHFFAVEPPAFLILSATKLLPLPAIEVTPNDCRRLRQELRDVHYNPQRHLPSVAAPAELIEEKSRWSAQVPRTKHERRQRFEAIRRVSAALREPLRGTEKELRRRLEECERDREGNAVLRRRDYAFCLYPEVELRRFCERFL